MISVQRRMAQVLIKEGLEYCLVVFFCEGGGYSQNLKQQKKSQRVGGGTPKIAKKMFGSRNTNIISPF